MATLSASSTMGLERTYLACVFAYLVVITVGLSTTTTTSYIFVSVVRVVAVLTVVLLLLRLHGVMSISRHQLLTMSMLMVFVAWAVLGSVFSGSIHLLSKSLIVDVAVSAAGLLVFSKAERMVLPDSIAALYLVYAFTALIIALTTDGLILDFPPRFSLEYASDHYGEEFGYGHGASNFYGLGAVAATFLLVRTRTLGLKMLVASVLVINLGLSVLGGARGDAAWALLIVGIYLAVQAPLKTALLVTLLFATTLVMTSDWTWIDDILLVQRFLTIGEGDYGYRDQLFAQVFMLLGEKPVCLIAGCGVGFFQQYYGYEISMYPHNFLLESLVIFGLPLTFLFASLVTYGAYRYYRKVRELDMFLLFMLYSFGVSMKSGSLFGSWFTLSGCLFLVSLCFLRWSDRSSTPLTGGVVTSQILDGSFRSGVSSAQKTSQVP